MYISGKEVYKNKYSRELAGILLIRLPPKAGKSFGISGNFLPVVVMIRSKRKFSKMRGWWWTYCSVTNRYVRLTERMNLMKANGKMFYRLWMRYRTLDIDYVDLRSDLGEEMNPYSYVSFVSRDNLFIFYLSRGRMKMILRSLRFDDILCKRLEFHRFGRKIINYITDDERVLRLFGIGKR